MKIASPTFYSLRDSRTPVMVSVASVALNLVLNIVLFRVMGFRGLALGTAIAAGFNALTLLVLLQRRHRRPRWQDGSQPRRSRSPIAAAVMGAVAVAGGAGARGWLPGNSELTRVLRVAAAIGAAIVALIAAARLLRIEEFTEASNRVLRRLLPKSR